MSVLYPVANVARSFRDCGHLLGTPIIKVTFAGASGPDMDENVCPLSRPADKFSGEQVAERVSRLLYDTKSCPWVWLGGAEPCEHDLEPLLEELRKLNVRIGMSTTGQGEAEFRERYCDFISLMPDGKPEQMNTLYGAGEIILRAGWNGVRLLRDWQNYARQKQMTFTHRWVVPMEGSKDAFSDCLRFIDAWPLWRLGVMANQVWKLP